MKEKYYRNNLLNNIFEIQTNLPSNAWRILINGEKILLPKFIHSEINKKINNIWKGNKRKQSEKTEWKETVEEKTEKIVEKLSLKLEVPSVCAVKVILLKHYS